MARERGLRIALFVGAAAGFVLGIAITLLMDTLYAGSLGGTWQDAISNDLNNLFSLDIEPGGLITQVVLAFIIVVHGAFGAFMGAVFSVFVFKLLQMLTKESG